MKQLRSKIYKIFKHINKYLDTTKEVSQSFKINQKIGTHRTHFTAGAFPVEDITALSRSTGPALTNFLGAKQCTIV